MASLTFDQIKDPTDVRPYAFNFIKETTDEVTGEPDVLIKCEIFCDSDDLLIEDVRVIDHYAAATFSGGEAGTTYVIECVVEFESGKVLNRSAKLKVKEL